MKLFLFISLAVVSLAYCVTATSIPECTNNVNATPELVALLADESDLDTPTVICVHNDLPIPLEIRIKHRNLVIRPFPMLSKRSLFKAATIVEHFPQDFTLFVIESNAQATFINLIIEEFTEFALHLQPESSVTLTDCIIRNVNKSAIALEKSVSLTVQGCTFRNNGVLEEGKFGGSILTVSDITDGMALSTVRILDSNFGFSNQLLKNPQIRVGHANFEFINSNCTDITSTTSACIYLYHAHATITNSRFERLSSIPAEEPSNLLSSYARGGAAILFSTNATFSDCTFIDLEAIFGSGIVSFSSESMANDLSTYVTLDNCNVRRCNAKIAGFMFSVGVVINIYDSSFYENTAITHEEESNAGVMYVVGGALNMERSSFEENIAGQAGGVGVLSQFGEERLDVYIDDCVFSRNTASSTGGVFLFAVPSHIFPSEMHAVLNTFVTIRNSIFLNNKVTEVYYMAMQPPLYDALKGSGGVIAFAYAKKFEVRIHNCQFISNEASQIGAAFAAFTLYDDPTNEFKFYAHDTVFLDNLAKNEVGSVMAMNIGDAKVLFQNVVFKSFTEQGQFLFFRGGPKAFNNCTFETRNEGEGGEGRRRRSPLKPEGHIFSLSETKASIAMGLCKFEKDGDVDNALSDVHLRDEESLVLQYGTTYALHSLTPANVEINDTQRPSEFCINCAEKDLWLCKALSYCENPPESYSFMDYEASILQIPAASSEYIYQSSQAYQSSVSVYSIRSRMSAIFDDPTLSMEFMSSSAAYNRRDDDDKNAFPVLPIIIGSACLLLLLLALALLMRRHRSGKTSNAKMDSQMEMLSRGSFSSQSSTLSSPAFIIEKKPFTKSSSAPIYKQENEYEQDTLYSDINERDISQMNDPAKPQYEDVVSSNNRNDSSVVYTDVRPQRN